jgi:ribosomal protein S21
MVTVIVDDKVQDPVEALNRALHKFNKELEKDNIMDEYKSRVYYEKPSIKAHRQKRYAEHKRKLENAALKKQ